jgi:hypothetical protein
MRAFAVNPEFLDHDGQRNLQECCTPEQPETTEAGERRRLPRHRLPVRAVWDGL